MLVVYILHDCLLNKVATLVIMDVHSYILIVEGIFLSELFRIQKTIYDLSTFIFSMCYIQRNFGK